MRLRDRLLGSTAACNLEMPEEVLGNGPGVLANGTPVVLPEPIKFVPLGDDHWITRVREMMDAADRDIRRQYFEGVFPL